MRKLIATLIIIGGLAASGFAATPATTAGDAEDGAKVNTTASADQNYDQSTTCPANDSQGDPAAPQNYVEYGAGG
jgi:hypothetical protein